MAARRGRKAGISEENLALLNAIKFATSIQKGTGLTDRQTHCRFFNNYVIATNDVLIIGVPVVGLSVECCPHSKTLIAALERCEGETTFTLDGSVLIVKSGRVRVPVPCIDFGALSDLAPDANEGSASPALSLALGQVAAIVDEDDDRLFCRPVYMASGLVQGTHKGHVAMQIWHGVTPLPEIALPKESAVAISKHASDLRGIGLSNTGGTATFWFADTSFIRSSLFDVKCPNLNHVLEQKIVADPTPVDGALFAAVKTLAPFTKDSLKGENANVVRFEESKVWAGRYAVEENASYDFPNSPIDNFTINSLYLLMFEALAESIVVDHFQTRLYLYSKNMRAAIAGMKNRGDE
jgi:hypothetical protein